jgi:hypothetical protein
MWKDMYQYMSTVNAKNNLYNFYQVRFEKDIARMFTILCTNNYVCSSKVKVKQGLLIIRWLIKSNLSQPLLCFQYKCIVWHKLKVMDKDILIYMSKYNYIFTTLLNNHVFFICVKMWTWHNNSSWHNNSTWHDSTENDCACVLLVAMTARKCLFSCTIYIFMYNVWQHW